MKLFGRNSFSEWMCEMSRYNQTCAPIAEMVPPIRYVSLDLFLVQIHPDKIAEVFDSWVNFAERVVPLIYTYKDARIWKLNRKLVIHRRHWLLLSKRVMRVVVKTIGLLSGGDFQNPCTGWSSRHDRLNAAAGRAALVYGGFAWASGACF